jgi:hypothetical protein
MAVIGGDLAIGPYTGAYTRSAASISAASIGLMEGPIRTQQNVIGLPIRASLYAQTVIDYVLQGMGCFLVFTLKEWNATTRDIMWPFDSTSDGISAVSGQLLSQYAGSLVFTAVPDTPAETEGPATRTFHYAALLPGHNLDVAKGAVERNVTIVMAILPQATNTVGNTKFYTDTYA